MPVRAMLRVLSTAAIFNAPGTEGGTTLSFTLGLSTALTGFRLRADRQPQSAEPRSTMPATIKIRPFVSMRDADYPKGRSLRLSHISPRDQSCCFDRRVSSEHGDACLCNFPPQVPFPFL